MRFMMLLKASPASEAGQLPSDALVAEMGKYNEELVNAGVLLDAAGLQSSARGARVRFAGSARSVARGPFPEPAQLISGFWMIRVSSLEEAIEWAKRCPQPHLGDEAEIELRQVFEPEDFSQAP
ncbi:MAG TPA: YciI family protein [Myxococcota bacterium]|nr:YciI family protein [Myxococcota bacterium]